MLPNSQLSSTALPAAFLAPRTGVRFDAAHGATDVHMGGIAIADASQGLSYQLWTAEAVDGDVVLSAPNTAPTVVLEDVGAVWVALAFDQNARPFVAYADADGNASFYWFDTLANDFVTTDLTGVVRRPFCALDDIRPAEIASSDIILAYVREGELYFRAQRDRYGTEYDLGAAPATLVQVGMNVKWRFQFAFQSVQELGLPPAEFAPSITS